MRAKLPTTHCVRILWMRFNMALSNSLKSELHHGFKGLDKDFRHQSHLLLSGLHHRTSLYHSFLGPPMD